MSDGPAVGTNGGCSPLDKDRGMPAVGQEIFVADRRVLLADGWKDINEDGGAVQTVVCGISLG